MIHRSPYAEVEIPTADVTSFVFENAGARADGPR